MKQDYYMFVLYENGNSVFWLHQNKSKLMELSNILKHSESAIIQSNIQKMNAHLKWQISDNCLFDVTEIELENGTEVFTYFDLGYRN